MAHSRYFAHAGWLTAYAIASKLQSVLCSTVVYLYIFIM